MENKVRARKRRYSETDNADHKKLDGDLVPFKQHVKTTFNSGALAIGFRRTEPCSNLQQFLLAMYPRIEKQVTTVKLLHPEKTLKIQLVVSVEYEKALKPGTLVTGHLRSPFCRVLHTSEIGEAVQKIVKDIDTKNVNFMRDSSGLRVQKVQHAELLIAQYNPLRGSAFIELPTYLKNKHAVINVRNSDNRCFGYAMLSALHPQTAHVDRAANYNRFFAEHPDIMNMNYPVSPDDLDVVEARLNIPINVFSYFDDQGRGLYPLYLSKIDVDKGIDLLFWSGHFAWIKNFSAITFSVTKSKHRKFFCKRCLSHFTTEDVLGRHRLFCRGDACEQIYTMQPEGTELSFRNIKHQQRAPFVIYADFESITKVVEQDEDDDSIPNPCPGGAYQHHLPCSVGVKVISDIGGDWPYEQHVGLDSATWLLEKVRAYSDTILAYLHDDQRMIMTSEDEQNFNKAAECHICKKLITDRSRKVRDHDHLTGKYRGAAHQTCNLLLRKQFKIPVFLHNFRGYDSHLIFHALGQFKGVEIKVIGQGMEKYLTLSWGPHVVFKDSYQFLSSSLEKLVQALSKNGSEQFKRLFEGFSGCNDVQKALLVQKGVYPYDHMSEMSRFDEDRLPSRAAFASRLKNAECSVADYEQAQQVWSAFQCKTMLDYHNLYLKTDVLLLADVFESFRLVAMQNYGIDPAFYVSAPHLAWDAMLKVTDCKLQLLSDSEMFRFVHHGLRGGVCTITKRRAKANNKYMGDLYDPTKPSSFITYLDANNLYGWAMSEPLPSGEFTWVEEHEWSQINWMAQTDDQALGYFIECDLDYPDALHDDHNDYPLAPERVTVTLAMLSDAQRGIRDHYSIKRDTSTKLIPNLRPKEVYCCHYRNLKFYIEHGLVLRKVHRVLKFKQSRWLQPYIAKNQQLRAATSDPFEKELFKLMNNAVYGKTCENLTKRTDVKIVTDLESYEKLVQKPHMKSYRIFSPDIAAVELVKVQCRINKPTYVGFVVLELSKLHMMRFHYDVIKQLYHNREAELLFTDTDSMVYHIATDDVYRDFLTWAHEFDFSNYATDHFCFNGDNKMVVGKFKDEAGGKQVIDFVGLRPKMYSYLTLDDKLQQTKECKKAKGIQYAALANVRHADYVRQLEHPEENYLQVHRIGGRLHHLYSLENAKRGLCAFDDKRFLKPDKINTYAFGHYRIRNIEQSQASIQPGEHEPLTVLRAADAAALNLPLDSDDDVVYREVHVGTSNSVSKHNRFKNFYSYSPHS